MAKGGAFIGVYRGATGTWFLDLNGNMAWDGPPVDAVVGWGGDPSDIPVVGDWNSGGTTKIGVFRKSTAPGISTSMITGPGMAPVDALVGWGGDPSDIPVVGIGTVAGLPKSVCSGSPLAPGISTSMITEPGMSPVDAVIGWGGDPSDMPVVGDWNGSGTAKIGVFRKATGTWFLDYNGNGAWDGPGLTLLLVGVEIK